jgi:hypothetical protein
MTRSSAAGLFGILALVYLGTPTLGCGEGQDIDQPDALVSSDAALATAGRDAAGATKDAEVDTQIDAGAHEDAGAHPQADAATGHDASVAAHADAGIGHDAGAHRDAGVASSFIRGVYIQTASYWNGTHIVLKASDLSAMQQAGITDVYAQVHFADTSSSGYASSLKPVVQFFRGTGIRVHAWSTPGNYNPTDNGAGSTNQAVINGVADIYANDYGMDGVCLDEFYSEKYPNAVQDVTNFHKTVFGIVKAHGGIATFCTTPEYAVAKSVYGVDYAAIGQYCDYVTPMAYVGDFDPGVSSYVGKVVAGIQALTSAKVFPVIESYVSDQDTTPKSVAAMNTEISSGIAAGADGYAVFRFGLLSGYPTAGPP